MGGKRGMLPKLAFTLTFNPIVGHYCICVRVKRIRREELESSPFIFGAPDSYPGDENQDEIDRLVKNINLSLEKNENSDQDLERKVEQKKTKKGETEKPSHLMITLGNSSSSAEPNSGSSSGSTPSAYGVSLDVLDLHPNEDSESEPAVRSAVHKITRAKAESKDARNRRKHKSPEGSPVLNRRRFKHTGKTRTSPRKLKRKFNRNELGVKSDDGKRNFHSGRYSPVVSQGRSNPRLERERDTSEDESDNRSRKRSKRR